MQLKLDVKIWGRGAYNECLGSCILWYFSRWWHEVARCVFSFPSFGWLFDSSYPQDLCLNNYSCGNRRVSSEQFCKWLVAQRWSLLQRWNFVTAKAVVAIGTFKGSGGCDCFLVEVYCPDTSFSIYVLIYVCINMNVWSVYNHVEWMNFVNVEF